jgi:hypothetical protein
MAKKRSKTRRAAGRAPTAPAAAAAAAGIPLIVVPPGSTMQIIVDVGPMVIPYAVAYAQRTVLKSLVDRAELLQLEAGDQVLAWSFEHTAKEWSHSIAYSIDGAPATLLEKKSEADKDSDVSVGFAIVRH